MSEKLLAIRKESSFPGKENKAALTQLLWKKKRVILFVDNAHLLTDEDFAFLGGLFSLTKHLAAVLQVVMVGNGEIVHRLARPENRPIYNMLGSIWTLPKLTRDQSLAYIRALLDSAGLASDIIGTPEAVAKRAAGVIGILRMLTITLALKALHSDQSCDAEEALNFGGSCPDDQTDASHGRDHADPKNGIGHFPADRADPGAEHGGDFIGVFLLFFSWLMPDAGLKDLFSGLTGGAGQSRVEQEPIPPPRSKTCSRLSSATHWQSVAKTVFRKRTSDGPYSIQLGAYPTMESLVLASAAIRGSKAAPVLESRPGGTGDSRFSWDASRASSKPANSPKHFGGRTGGLQAICGHGRTARESGPDQQRQHEPGDLPEKLDIFERELGQRR